MPDVIVLGGGPSGAAAAIGCAGAGLDVLVLERPRGATPKTGETLHPGVEPLLERLGVGDAVRAANFIRHDGIDVAWGSATRFVPYGADESGRWQGIQARRDVFDDLLLDAAVARGVTLQRNVQLRGVSALGERRVVVESDAGPLTARWLVDASGHAHWLARRIGLPIAQLGPQLLCEYGYVKRPGGARPSLFGDITGWTWQAEVAPGLYQWTRLDLAARRQAGPAPGETVGTTRRADVTWRWFPRSAGPGYFLVGDAAAVLDPASSHGVLRALMTGMYAAHFIAACARDQRNCRTAPGHYAAWLQAWILHDVTELRRHYAQVGIRMGVSDSTHADLPVRLSRSNLKP